MKDERGMRTPTLNAASGTKKEPAGVSGRGLLVCRDVHGPLMCLANDIVSRLFLPSQRLLRGVGDGLAPGAQKIQLKHGVGQAGRLHTNGDVKRGGRAWS